MEGERGARARTADARALCGVVDHPGASSWLCVERESSRKQRPDIRSLATRSPTDTPPPTALHVGREDGLGRRVDLVLDARRLRHRRAACRRATCRHAARGRVARAAHFRGAASAVPNACQTTICLYIVLHRCCVVAAPKSHLPVPLVRSMLMAALLGQMDAPHSRHRTPIATICCNWSITSEWRSDY